MRKNCAIHSHDIVAFVHHHAPQVILQVALKFDPKRPIIPSAVEAAVNLAGLENETAPLAQADDLFHKLAVVLVAHWRMSADFADFAQIYQTNSFRGCL